MCILCILACAYKYERSMHTLHSSRHSTSSYVQYGYNESYTYSLEYNITLYIYIRVVYAYSLEYAYE